MSKLIGVFDNFTNLGTLSTEEISRWLPFKIETHALENFLANRIIYPQSVAMSPQEMEMDLAILREAARRTPGFFYNGVKKELTIPEVFEKRFSPIERLIGALLEVLPIEGVAKILVKDTLGVKQVGSVFVGRDALAESSIKADQKELKVKKGSLIRLPLDKRIGEVTINEVLVAVFGGRAGVFIDFREKRV